MPIALTSYSPFPVGINGNVTIEYEEYRFVHAGIQLR